ncbi:MAG TPA: GspH/FimT family pseudopilin [Gammaproteobacteria bacterium]|nr:GspH/FimT family pseudopilin [Gammaproteobacteria bacterium]
MKTEKNQGFTLVEVLMAIMIVGILAAVAIPAMGNFIRNSRITASVNDFVTAVTIARSEATKRRGIMTICPSNDPLAATPSCAETEWENGWLVFADADGDAVLDASEEVVHRQAPLTEVFIRTSNDLEKYVSFSSRGETRSTTGASVTGNLVVCDDRGIQSIDDVSTARGLVISRTGRAQSLRYQAEITALDIDCP